VCIRCQPATIFCNRDYGKADDRQVHADQEQILYADQYKDAPSRPESEHNQCRIKKIGTLCGIRNLKTNPQSSGYETGT